MAAIGNVLGHDLLRKAFATAEVKAALQAILARAGFGPGSSPSRPDYPRTHDACCRLGPAARVVAARP